MSHFECRTAVQSLQIEISHFQCHYISLSLLLFLSFVNTESVICLMRICCTFCKYIIMTFCAFSPTVHSVTIECLSNSGFDTRCFKVAKRGTELRHIASVSLSSLWNIFENRR